MEEIIETNETVEVVIEQPIKIKYANPEGSSVVLTFEDESQLSFSKLSSPSKWSMYDIDKAIEELRVEDFITDADILAQKEQEVRSERDRLLLESDLDLLKHLEVIVATDETLKAYRQALRDVPQDANFPENELPTK